jgi:RNA polymerase sigma-70 factor (ECF subfamily)
MDDDPEEVHSLARLAREGDREALAELVERLRLPLFALAYAELRHYQDAQDAVAAALLRICRSIGDLREPERTRSWMEAVTRNEARRLLRQRLGHPCEPGLLESDAAPEETASCLLRIDVERALRRLPAEQGNALALFYLAGVPIREIARRTGRPEGTVKNWLHQGRRRLAGEMKEYAPMTHEWTASIVSTGPDTTMAQLVEALRGAGWSEVRTVQDYAAAGRLRESGAGEAREFGLPEPLRGSRFILLDDPVGARSAFELIPLLNATTERKQIAVGLLFDPGEDAERDVRLLSAWVSGVDLALTKPVDPVELRRFAEVIRKKLADGAGE